MAFETLSQKLTETFRKWTKQDRISDKHLDSLLSEVRTSLLEADVNAKVVTDFLKSIQEKALGQKIFSSLKPNEALMKIVYDEMVELLGPTSPDFDYPEGQKRIILLVGLQGTGKTTSAAKFAHLLKTKKNRKPLLVAADCARPAAVEQLVTLGNSIGVDVVYETGQKDALSVVRKAITQFRNGTHDTLIIDTAGRLHIDDALMGELEAIRSLSKPDEILLTVDAMTGQDVVQVAESFHNRLNVTGLIVTKFDSDAKGGAVLSVKALTQVPVKLVGTGEKIDEYDIFYPDRMANRLIGMGDLMSLVEQAQTKLDSDLAERSMKRMLEGQFTFEDMLDQFNQLSKMGSLKAMMGMLPGMGQLSQQVNDEDSQTAIKKSKAIILSMTLEEREDASVLRASRKARIAAGSGTTVTDVNRLINQYEKAKEQMRMIKRLAKNNPKMF